MLLMRLIEAAKPTIDAILPRRKRDFNVAGRPKGVEEKYSLKPILKQPQIF
jgi:hypothetical protein